MTSIRLTKVVCDGCGETHEFKLLQRDGAVDQLTNREGWSEHGNDHFCETCVLEGIPEEFGYNDN